ncbi:MAG: tandem-95 repeat protein [Kangiellaceae bacterium]|nr:tandem-95 repeat protein [Kangiellaceae bacterium]
MNIRFLANKINKLATIALFALLSTQIQAEGSYQFGDTLNQPLRSTTTVYIHVPNAGDLIRVHLCRNGNSAAAVVANISNTTFASEQYSANTVLANLSSTQANIDCADPMTSVLPKTPVAGQTMEFAVPSAGVYALDFDNNGGIDYARWDFSVVPSGTPNIGVDATDDAGNVFSYQWVFDTGSFSKAAGATGQMFILVPGGFPSTNYVWSLDLQEFSGNVYEIVANDLGLDAPVSGISAPTSTNNVTDKYPVYLTYPTGANPAPAPVQFPALTDTLIFVDDAGNDAVISPDGDAIEETGNFEFTPDVDGTYALTIDINRDGEFGANDRLLLGRMTANVLSVVNWNGTDAAGTTVPNASYPVKLELRVGEYHFIAEDAETSGGGTNDDGTGDDDGLTILQATDQNTLVGTQVYWDDETLLTGNSNLPDGAFSSIATTGDHRHTWGQFDSGGIGNQSYIDTYVFGNSTEVSVTAIVAAVNTAPTIDDDTFNIDENSAITTSVGTPTSNDVDGDFLSYSITGGNTGNVFAITDLTGEITVNGPLDEETTDQYILTVEVSDQASTDTATITIDINDINDAPVADNQAVGVSEDIVQAIILTASDDDLDPLTFSVVGNPSNGSLTGTAPNLIYTPNLNYVGNDSFTFTANDLTVDSAIATISISVSSVNDAPVANGQAVNVTEDIAQSITLSGSDIDLDPLTYQVTNNPTNGTLSGTAPNLTYTPNLNFVGNDSFTFTANDLTVDSAIATISITVSNVNDAPVANGQAVNVAEDIAQSITLSGADFDFDPLTYQVTNNPSNGTLSGTAPNLTYTPLSNFAGLDSFTFQVNDGVVDSADATVSITINNTNDAPFAVAQIISTVEDTPSGITLAGSDLDLDPLTFSVITNPTNGLLSGTAPNLTYTPNANFNGNDSFIFKANDGTVDSNLAAVSITVTGVNDAPVADAQSVAVTEDTAQGITLTGSDVDSDPLTYTVVALPTNGILTGTAPNLSYTPAADFTGSDSFTFQLNDGTIDSVLATVSLTVSNVNDAPVADNQAVAVTEDTAQGITLTGSDVDSDPLTYTLVALPANGTLTGTAPNLSYTPAADFTGSDSFTFQVNDSTIDSVLATVSLTVSNVNDAPVADDQSVSATEDSPTNLVLTGSDVDLDSITFSVVTNPTNGSLSGTAPNLTYTPTPDFAGSDSFTFRTNDGVLNSTLATITLSVAGANDAPTADGQALSAVEDVPLAIILSGSDIDNDPLSFIVTTNPTNGTLVGTSPNLTYTPSADFSGVDSFVFKSNDGTVDSNLATVTITIESDVDGDGIPDSNDPDDDNDGIPDDVEGTDDPDGDGIPNNEDTDSDGDGILDSEEGNVDTDGDGTPDYLDEDSDGDGHSDADEGTGDSDGDGTPDYLDDSSDEDQDGIPDIVEGTGDSDGDGIADYLDPDSDNDGIPDSAESVVVGNDEDGDGIDDAFDVDQTGGDDANGDGIDDNVTPLDTDDDGTPDYLDIDSDDDGIPDVIESVIRETDTDGDGIHDGIDVDQTGGIDSDGDGIDDAFDASITGGLDADLDGVDDLLEPQNDQDGDGTFDYLDLDSDDDGISDTAESAVTGDDTDGDGIDDSYDVDITGGFDINNDGIDDDGSVVDTDGDTVADMHDLDSDNDSLFDTVEAGLTDDDENALADAGHTLVEDPIDSDGDGIADFRDIDSDNDGANDIDDTEFSELDADNDGQIDISTDQDGDGIDDSHDLEPTVHGTRPADRDQDDDGIADVTEGSANTDGDVNDNYLDRDSDNDGLSDAFETDRPAPSGNDTDQDGIDDTYDVDATGGTDVNMDGVDDQFIEVDTDGDGDADYLDLDSDNDGISDSEEQVLVTLTGLDSDSDGIDDAVDVDSTGGSDLNADGIDDATLNQDDLDGDGLANFRDLDSDGDGIPDSEEGTVDSDEDGLPDYLDLDSDGDGILDSEEGTLDTDGDGIPNYLDLDSDGDGILDSHEGNVDTDGDGIPDYLDVDSDDDGVSDEEEGTGDTDGDGDENYVDPDSDGDGINDGLENGDFNNDGTNDRLQATDMVETGLTGAGSNGVLMLIAMLTLFAVRRKQQFLKLAAVFVSLASFSAQANEPCEFGEAFGKGECWYLGAGVGQSKLRPDPHSTSWRISDDKDTAFKIFTGFPLSEHLFVEATYEDMGAAEMYNLNPSITENLDVGYKALGASLGYWLRDQKEEWNVYAKAGLSFMDTRQGQYVDQDYGTQLTFGAGVQWRFTEDWFTRLDLTSYDKDARIIGLSIGKYFGGGSKREPQKVVAPVAIPMIEKPEPKVEAVVPATNPDLDGDGVLNEADNCPATPTGTKVAVNGCPLMEAITLNIQFDTAKSLVKDEFLKEINDVAELIKQRGNVQVTVEGHTDWRGKQVNNQPLSESRAAAVANVLKQITGLKDDSFEVIGHGELKPVADNNTEQGRYKNRRVVVVISQK